MMQKQNLISIIGASSKFGIALWEQLSSHQDIILHGTFRRDSGLLASTFGKKSACSRAQLTQLDISDPKQIDDYIEMLFNIPQSQNVTIVYCCGKWLNGPVTAGTTADIDEVITVGFSGPVHVTRSALRRLPEGRRIKLIFVGGLCNPGAPVPFNSIYNAAMTSQRTFIKSVAEELSGTTSSCMAFSLGLFDKGQPYINDLCRQLPIAKPAILDDIIQHILPYILKSSTLDNGAIIELSGGLGTYRDVARILSRNSKDIS